MQTSRPQSAPGLGTAKRAPDSVLVVVNRCCGGGRGGNLWRRTVPLLEAVGIDFEVVDTLGDGKDARRVAERLTESGPDVVLAAGGDGTIALAVEAMMSRPTPRFDLAFLPFGTANNIARSLGLRSCRESSDEAISLAVAALRAVTVRRLDIGVVTVADSKRYFVGSFAVGMDADILARRNRWARRSPLRGYALYLASCAFNLGCRHGGTAQLTVDDRRRVESFYNLLITNTPLYAGEFRFDGTNNADDGCLDLLRFERPFEYVRSYAAAWRRHVHWTRGDEVGAMEGLQRVRAVEIDLDVEVAGQIDGEEVGPARRWRIGVLPGALQVRLPDLSVR